MEAFAAGLIALQLTVASIPAPHAQTAISGDVAGVYTQASPASVEVYQAPFTARSLSAALAELHVNLGVLDTAQAFPDPVLGVGSKITISRAPVVVVRDGSAPAKTIPTWQPTLAAFADEAGLDIAELDKVSLSLETPVTSGLELVITRVQVTSLVKKVTLESPLKTIDDPELQKGKERVVEAGAVGERHDTYTVRRENGKEVFRTLVKQEVVKQPVTRVIAKGTKIVSYGEGGASWYGGVPALTAAHRTLPFGTKVRVVAVNSGKSVVVTIADRGPFIAGRVIDLSKDAFAVLAPVGAGVIQVRLEAL